jgi:hypothetical protein
MSPSGGSIMSQAQVCAEELTWPGPIWVQASQQGQASQQAREPPHTR